MGDSFDSSKLSVNTSGPQTDNGQPSTTGSKKKSKSGPPISVEDIFNKVSVVTSSNMNPPAGKILLTPRSAEVCLKLGVNPEILKIRDIDSFWEPNIEPAVQRIRHEAYVQRRHELMKQCRLERKRLINKEFEQSGNLQVSATLTPEMLLEQQREQSSTLIQLELKRIEKMQKRQEKELEGMIQFEISRAKTQQEFELRMQKDKKKDELRKKQQEKRLRLMAEEGRLRELQKVALEEAEEENRRAVAKDMYEREVTIAEDSKRKLEQARREAIEIDLEKKRKHEDHRRITQKFFEDENMKLRERLESMQGAEKKKQDAILEKQKYHADALLKKREIVEARLRQNMSYARKNEETRKEAFLEKQNHHETIRELALRKQEEERQLHAQEIMLQEQRRRMILLQKRKEEEKKAESMIIQFEEAEKHVEEVQEIREREHMINKEKQAVRTQMKYENVDRVGRVKEYQRLTTLKKIEDTDSRVKSMLTQREELVAERRRAAAETKRQKEAITKVMDEVRTNATKASKLISAALSGKLSFADLTKTSTSSPVSRTKSASRDRKTKTSSDLLGLDRESKSAGNNGDEYNNDVKASDHEYFNTAADGATPSKPYVSPYDSIA